MSWLTPELVGLLAQGLVFITSLLAGILVGTMRLSTRPIVRRLGAIYIDLFRNIPALVLIIFFAFALPNLIPLEARRHFFFDNTFTRWGQTLTGLSLPYYMLAAIVALTLNTSAYLAELFRAGTRTIPLEYVDAARSLGATPAAVFWQILLLQGFRAAFPAITTRLIHNLKRLWSLL
jgi:His/Glu/Gln/Arg/opine family amino acid ABC transporter permease subunit